MKRTGIVLMSSFFVFSQLAFASPNHEHPAPTMPKEFDTLKQLVGTWEGTTKMGDRDQAITVVYEMTSGGTAITEKTMAGTPHEMISVYHKDGKTLAMTHYCSLGNAPEMQLKKADAKQIAFEMIKPMGVSSMKEEHMHALTLTFTDANTMTQEWVNYQNGKKAGTVTFTLKKKQ